MEENKDTLTKHQPVAKKKKKETVCYITDRDVQIFHCLSCGAVSFLQILTMLKKRYHREISKDVLMKRISRLSRAGYIERGRYQDRDDGQKHYALYSLNTQSMEALIAKGVPRKQMRLGLPGKFMVTHELALTDIIRAIDRESSSQQYEWGLVDEKELKSRTGGSGKGMVYPDLIVRLIFKIAGEEKIKSIAVEYDNSTMKALDVYEKVKALSRNTLMLCKDTRRVNELRKAMDYALSEDSLYIDRISRKVFFGLLSDFYQNGFLRTEFVFIDGSKALVL